MRQRYPKIRLRLQTADDPVAMLEHEVDVAMTFGRRTPGGRWVSMELFPVRQVLVASEGYLARHGSPAQAADLPEHQLLVWAAPGEDPTRVRLRRGGYIEVVPALSSPDIHLLLELAGAGLGIAYAPWIVGVPFQGLQVPPAVTAILTESVADDRALRVVVPAAMEGIPRIRALLRELRQMSAAFIEVTRGADAVA